MFSEYLMYAGIYVEIRAAMVFFTLFTYLFTRCNMHLDFTNRPSNSQICPAFQMGSRDRTLVLMLTQKEPSSQHSLTFTICENP